LDEKFIPDSIARTTDIPEVNYPVTSVNGQTGDVILDVPKSFSGSWNDLTDKPFEKKAGNTVEMLFDGNLDGRTTVYMGSSSTSPTYESTYVKMSDVIPEKEWFLGHNIVITDAQKGGTYNFTITEETLNEIIDSEEANLPSEYLPEGSFWLMSELIIVFREKTVMLAPSGDSYLTFEPGIWFSYIVFEESANAVQPMYCTELSFSSPEFIKYIDEDVIPNTIARKNNISWDDLKYKPFDYIKKDTQFHYEWNGIWDDVTDKNAWAYKIDGIIP
jgi:hypothetical protein